MLSDVCAEKAPQENNRICVNWQSDAVYRKEVRRVVKFGRYNYSTPEKYANDANIS